MTGVDVKIRLKIQTNLPSHRPQFRGENAIFSKPMVQWSNIPEDLKSIGWEKKEIADITLSAGRNSAVVTC